jgi:uncharacterized metal-binding protein YceD (DUF177 family)
VIVYEGDHVDLEEPLQESLILTINPFWHPERDANDRCTYCKRDCTSRVWGEEKQEGGQKSSSFGNLLKGALNAAKK